MRPIPRIGRANKGKIAQKTARTVDVPAPIGGLNTRDSLSLMPITDAVTLTNWVPASTGLMCRRGYQEATTSYSTSVESVIPYVSGAIKTLITAHNGNLYTDDGAGTASSIGSGYSNNRWFAAQVSSNMILVNGEDAPQQFNGSTISTPSYSGDLATYGEENINGIVKHKSRLYMWDSRYGNFFYGGTNSVSGAFTEFDLDQVSDTAGNILEIKTISRDAGDGPDDYIAFMLDTGEVLIYQGSDPGNANDWSLVGKYMTPPLVAKGCAISFAGDVLMVVQNDLIKLSEVIKYGSQEGGFNITPSKLSGAIYDAYQTYGTNYGWQLISYPTAGWIIINIPVAVGSEYIQYVVNTVTGAATKFEGWNAIQFGYLNGVLYFGASVDLYKADSGLDDNGADISLVALPAYNNLGIPQRKKVSNARQYMLSEGELNIDLSIGYDYEAPSFQGTQTSFADGAEWDAADWDAENWAGLSSRLINFVTSGVGLYVSAQTSIKLSGQQLVWHSTTYNFDLANAY